MLCISEEKEMERVMAHLGGHLACSGVLERVCPLQFCEVCCS